MSEEAEGFVCLGERSYEAWLTYLAPACQDCLKPVLVQHWQVWEKEILVSR